MEMNKLALLLCASIECFASGFTVTAFSSNTQTALVFDSPGGSCNVEVSDNQNMTPLVHDVDPALFPGSGSDSRASSINNGAHRIFVAGARTTDKAQDGLLYSRALQAYALHYYRITCGNSAATGTFHTATIPFNMTYQDTPQVAFPGFGGTVIPTMSSTDRNWTVIDPHTGALIKPVSLYADHGWPGTDSHTGPFLYFGGSTKVCTKDLVGSPAIGFLCGFAQGAGGPGALYYIIPSTGESRYLGNWTTPYPLIDPIDGRFYTMIDGHDLIYQVYSGDYATGYPSNTGAPFSTTKLAAGIPAMIHAFDSTFDNTAFSTCSVDQFEGVYAVFSCLRGQQDSYGWLAVMDVTSAAIIAAFRLDGNANYHWTGVHHVDPMYDAAGMILTTHSLVGSGDGPQLGMGPYITAYASTNPLAIGSTILAVSGEPSCIPCGTDPLAPSTMKVGDHFVWLDTFEGGTVVAKASPTSWTITPTTMAHAPATKIRAEGNYTQFVWKFLLDPHGTDTTGTSGIVSEKLIDGHDDIVTNLLLMESYSTRIGDVLAQAGKPWSYSANVDAAFAGAKSQCYGTGCAAHPSGVGVQPWFVDALQWDGAIQAAGSIGAALAGQVYKFSGASTINPKQMAQAGAIDNPFTAGGGPHILVDVSGPGVVLGTTSVDNYKYVIANAPGEGLAGSSIGDIYVNLPGTPRPNCDGGGMCLNNFYPYGNGDIQISTDLSRRRVITGGLASLKQLGGTPSARALYDGSWLLFTTGYYLGVPPSQVLMAKLPPFSGDSGVDRTTFLRAPVNIKSPGGSVASATLEFWYAEQGGYCTSRRETCVAVATTVTDATPFWYKTTDAYAKQPCTNACTITVPVLPMHVAYYTVKFYDASGSFLQDGESGVVVDKTRVAIQ